MPDTPYVSTIAGPLPTTELQRILTHEHLNTLVPGGFLNGGADDDQIAMGIRATARLKAQGFNTVVNLTGRDMVPASWATIKSIAEGSGLNVIAGHGYYTERMWPEAVKGWNAEQFDAALVEAATHIPGTDVPAGAYGEIATSLDLITDGEAMVLQAVARAHRQTGLPIFTHCSLGTMTREQVDILDAAGADLEQVAIGHVDLQPQPDRLEELLRRGVTLAFDTFGKQHFDYILRDDENYEPGNELKRKYTRLDTDRADAFAELVQRGWERQLIISTDMTGREALHEPRDHGILGYSFVAEVVIPLSTERGVTDTQLDGILSDNPKRLLTVRK